MKLLHNILGILLGIVAAFLLFLVLFFTPLVSSFTKMLQPQTIQQLLNEVDLQEELQKIIDQNSFSELNGLDTAFVKDIVKSELMEEIIEIYIENLLGVLEEDDVKLLSEKQITPLLKKHLPEMSALLKSYLPPEITLTDAQISEYTLTTIEPLILEIASMLPTLEELGLDEGMISFLQYTYDKTILKYTLLAVIILSAIILFLRFPRFKGFMWLTVIYTISALQFLCIKVYLSMEDIPDLEDLPAPILKFFADEYQLTTLITFVCAIAFLVIFIAGRKIFPPKENTEFTSSEDSF